MASKILIALLLFTCSGGVFGADLSDARKLAETGDTEGAVKAYRDWLAANPSSDEYAGVALEVAAVMDDLSSIRTVLEDALGRTTTPKLRHELLRELGNVASETGDLAAAQAYFRDASFALPGVKDFESLLESALLSFELGEYRNAEAQARVIVETGSDATLVTRADVLLSRIYYATDRVVQARTLLLTDELSPRPDLGAAGLYWLFRLSLLTNDSALAQKVRSALDASYPDSMESAMAEGEVNRYPSPSAMFEALADSSLAPTADEDASPETEGRANTGGPEPAASTPEVISIQTGSFTIRENAEYAAADLESEGFTAQIEERWIDGARYFRVVVPSVPVDDVGSVILNLKEKGFEGFPIYE